MSLYSHCFLLAFFCPIPFFSPMVHGLQYIAISLLRYLNTLTMNIAQSNLLLFAPEWQLNEILENFPHGKVWTWCAAEAVNVHWYLLFAVTVWVIHGEIQLLLSWQKLQWKHLNEKKLVKRKFCSPWPSPDFSSVINLILDTAILEFVISIA